MASANDTVLLNDTFTQVPSTPPRARTRSAQSNGPMNKSALASPPPLSHSMTPPPSTQPPRNQSPRLNASIHDPSAALVSPPQTIKYYASTTLPTPGSIDGASLEDVRNIAQDLVAAVKEARLSAAHFKLQYSLLAMEAHEAAQRAEVEHQMTRREVEVLHAAEHKRRTNQSTTPRNSVPPSQPHLDALTKTCKDLEDERDETDQRLQRAKKLIELEKDKAELLMEENSMLKRRIRENREHFTRMKSQSPMYTTPRDAYTTPRRQAPPRFPESASNIAALLAADQVLSGESISVPSTPTKSQASKFKQGHLRGAHSLSSLHTTPQHNRPLTSDGFADTRFPLSAPGSQLVNESAVRERHERDSTISMSDADDDASEGDVQQSQASSLATDMLRKNPASQESLRLAQNAERSSNLLQAKLLGSVKKPGISRKRQGSFGEDKTKAKKARLNQGVGLGIETWNHS